VEICKELVQRQSALAANVKARIEGICNKAAVGDIAGARAAIEEVCVAVLNASPMSADARKKALASCKAS
jgi:hypothetical protein